ncbi:MAG: 50S ribosomal protein L24 [Clostridia bacterium]|nr:50S ribosomal protein L24 [Clostridia bacterium]
MNVKLNDNVVVITGKDAGKQGKVIATSPKNNTVTVEGINIQTKAQKARRANETSQIVKKEGAIDASNVMVVCAGCGKGVRVKHQIVDGKKVRVCGKCGAVLDTAYAGKGKGKAAEVKEAPKKRTRKRAAKAEAAAETTTEDKAE